MMAMNIRRVKVVLRYVIAILFLFLTRPLYLIDTWFGEDQRANTIRHMFQNRLDHVFEYYQLLYTQ